MRWLSDPFRSLVGIAENKPRAWAKEYVPLGSRRPTLYEGGRLTSCPHHLGLTSVVTDQKGTELLLPQQRHGRARGGDKMSRMPLYSLGWEACMFRTV